MTEQLHLGLDGHTSDSSMVIPGLLYVRDFLDPHEEQIVVNRVDIDHADDWRPDLSRRVQHFGYRYDYRSRRVDKSMALGPLPSWLRELASRVQDVWGEEQPPDQVIVNEYLPGQGIAPHVDCEPCFGPVVATLSIGSAITMKFDKVGQSEPAKAQRLDRRSLTALSGPARYKWRHSIAPRKSDNVEGVRTPRSRRLSLTFRTVKLS